MKSLWYLNKYFYKYRWRLLLGLIFLIVTNYFGVKMPVIMGNATEKFVASMKSHQEFDVIFEICMQFVLLYIGVAIAKGIFLFFQRQTIIVASRLIEFDLKNEVYEKYQELDYTFYKSRATGDLMNRISEDVAQVRSYLGPGIMYTLNLVVLFPMVCIQMLMISPKLTLFSLIPLPIMAVLIYFVSTKMNILGRQVQEEQSRLSTIGQETFAGMRVIKAYIQERQTRKRFDESSETYRKKNMKLVMVNALFMPTIAFLIGTSTLISIYIGGLLTVPEGVKAVPDGQISPGNIVTFIMFIYMLTWPFASVGWVTSIIQRAAASQQRINEFLTIRSNVTNETNEQNDELQKITFENVSFRYPDARSEVLRDLSFSIGKSETLGVIGRTGSGKSTLIQLLMRQMDPTAGVIKYNEKSLKEVNLDQYHGESSIVPQDVFLFSDTIRNNIAFGVNESRNTMDNVTQAAKDAHVLHNIEAFDEKFETLLGERGVNLSGGQKQRVSIARALIRNPRLLILDDCLSAVDTETEEIILNNLRRYSEEHGTTTVIVSHRISSLRNASKIIVLEDGVIAESGTHAELLNREGLYKEMHLRQLAEEAVKANKEMEN
jgi:ATP-binding cassette, subfamily B, multidrug efflux pump